MFEIALRSALYDAMKSSCQLTAPRKEDVGDRRLIPSRSMFVLLAACFPPLTTGALDSRNGSVEPTRFGRS